MKYFDCTVRQLESFTIEDRRMLEWERKIFTSTGAYLFLGAYKNSYFGSIRQIETGEIDENGRVCYHNIAFEENAAEAGIVIAILNFAKNRYMEFVRDINDLIYNKDMDYFLNEKKFEILLKKWNDNFDEHRKLEKSFLVPESSPEYFFSNTKAPFSIENIRNIIQFEEIKKENINMKLFFYCSSPSIGFVLKQIDFSTGNVLKEKKEAARAMPPDVFAIMTRSGAGMALFKINDNICFIAKNIQSEKADRYGRKKYVSIAFEAGGEQKEMLSQFAAWALLDFKAFSAELTDCLEVFDGPQGYSVKIKMLRELLMRFAKKIQCIPSKYHGVWSLAVKPQTKEKFRYLVVDASLEYFNRSTELKISKEQIAMLISNERFEMWKHAPLALEFTENLYLPLNEEKKGVTEKEKNNSSQKKICSKENNHGKISAQEVKKGSGAQETIAEAKKDNRTEDRIDLLDFWQFRLVLAVGGIVAVIVIILWIRDLLFSH